MFNIPSNKQMRTTDEGELDVEKSLRSALVEGRNPIGILQELAEGADDEKVRLGSASKLADVLLKLMEKGGSGVSVVLNQLDLGSILLQEIKDEAQGEETV